MCNKVHYVSRRDAMAAARWVASRARPQHAYLCRRCGYWHLSSMARGAGRKAAKRGERRERYAAVDE